MSAQTVAESARRVLAGARDAALRLGHDAVGAEHVALALLDDPKVGAAFTGLGVPLGSARERLEAAGRRGRPRSSAVPNGAREPPYTSHAKRLIELATTQARGQGSDLAAEHLDRKSVV